MAANQNKPVSINYSLVIEEEEEVENDAVFCNGCGWFRVFGSKGYEGRNLLRESAGEEWWVVKKMKKLKEVTEMFAGPKWKTLIRKMGGYLKRKKQRNKFQYDPQSYALNFDREEEAPQLGFSARFAMPMASKELR